ncbi:MAG TPA: LPS export ABC transporter periplasmic protein LptC [Chiayiivirga sp.]|nr:LPS export ABC transporter periplasmic protein LptC [Chiayiivirga sp.]
MTLPRWAPGAALLLAAVSSSLLLWWLYRQDQTEPLTGPPRSDYFLTDFELVALDAQGKESFHVTGPHLSRHPYLGTIEIEQPRFLFPDDHARAWTARAQRAWASADGTELRLSGEVALDGPSEDADADLQFRTDSLVLHPREHRVSTPARVEFISPHSILRGRGLQADLKTRRFQLLDEVSGHYDTPTSKSRR